MPTTPDVGGGGNRVGGFDRRRHSGRSGAGHARLAFGDEVGGLAGRQRRRRAGDRSRCPGRAGDLFGDRGEVVAERFFARLQPVHRFAARRLRRLQLGEARLRFFAGGGDFALLDGDRVARFLDLRTHGGHPLDGGAGLVAQRPDPGGNRVVIALDLIEVFGAGAHLRPARRV